ncbi:hypothetical protein Droror1_Dr00022599 [Drosera rotundifolia]
MTTANHRLQSSSPFMITINHRSSTPRSGHTTTPSGLRACGGGKITEKAKPGVRLVKKKDKNGNTIEFESNMCHQCQRNDKERVIRCINCKTKRYCIPCFNACYVCCEWSLSRCHFW